MKNLLIILLLSFAISAFAQHNPPTNKEAEVAHKYRISTPVITLPQLVMDSWDERKHTQHIEIHVKRNLDNKNIIGLKFATWRLWESPGGMAFWIS